jgi:hypothetical protein
MMKPLDEHTGGFRRAVTDTGRHQIEATMEVCRRRPGNERVPSSLRLAYITEK